MEARIVTVRHTGETPEKRDSKVEHKSASSKHAHEEASAKGLHEVGEHQKASKHSKEPKPLTPEQEATQFFVLSQIVWPLITGHEVQKDGHTRFIPGSTDVAQDIGKRVLGPSAAVDQFVPGFTRRVGNVSALGLYEAYATSKPFADEMQKMFKPKNLLGTGKEIGGGLGEGLAGGALAAGLVYLGVPASWLAGIGIVGVGAWQTLDPSFKNRNQALVGGIGRAWNANNYYEIASPAAKIAQVIDGKKLAHDTVVFGASVPGFMMGPGAGKLGWKATQVAGKAIGARVPPAVGDWTAKVTQSAAAAIGTRMPFVADWAGKVVQGPAKALAAGKALPEISKAPAANGPEAGTVKADANPNVRAVNWDDQAQEAERIRASARKRMEMDKKTIAKQQQTLDWDKWERNQTKSPELASERLKPAKPINTAEQEAVSAKFDELISKQKEIVKANRGDHVADAQRADHRKLLDGNTVIGNGIDEPLGYVRSKFADGIVETYGKDFTRMTTPDGKVHVKVNHGEGMWWQSNKDEFGTTFHENDIGEILEVKMDGTVWKRPGEGSPYSEVYGLNGRWLTKSRLDGGMMQKNMKPLPEEVQFKKVEPAKEPKKGQPAQPPAVEKPAAPQAVPKATLTSDTAKGIEPKPEAPAGHPDVSKVSTRASDSNKPLSVVEMINGKNSWTASKIGDEATFQAPDGTRIICDGTTSWQEVTPQGEVTRFSRYDGGHSTHMEGADSTHVFKNPPGTLPGETELETLPDGKIPYQGEGYLRLHKPGSDPKSPGTNTFFYPDGDYYVVNNKLQVARGSHYQPTETGTTSLVQDMKIVSNKKIDITLKPGQGFEKASIDIPSKMVTLTSGDSTAQIVSLEEAKKLTGIDFRQDVVQKLLNRMKEAAAPPEAVQKFVQQARAEQQMNVSKPAETSSVNQEVKQHFEQKRVADQVSDTNGDIRPGYKAFPVSDQLKEQGILKILNSSFNLEIEVNPWQANGIKTIVLQKGTPEISITGYDGSTSSYNPTSFGDKLNLNRFIKGPPRKWFPSRAKNRRGTAGGITPAPACLTVDCRGAFCRLHRC